MTYPRFAPHWDAVREQQDWPLFERQTRHDFDQSIDWTVNPEGRTTSAWQAYLGLRLWGVNKEAAFAKYCLEVARRNSEEALRHNTFAAIRPTGSFPRNRCRFLESKIFIDAFVGGDVLSGDTALAIAADEESIAPGYDRRQWDGYPQSRYLHAVDLLLLVGEYDRARVMLQGARSLNGLHVKDVARITKLIAKSPETVGDNQEARERYRHMFDLLRDPKYSDGLRGHPGFTPQLLIMACIWQKYFDPGQGTYSLDKAIDLVRE